MPKDMDNTSPLYEAMKRRSPSAGTKRETPLQLYFQINVDEHGAYLRIIDDSRRDIEPDPRGYSNEKLSKCSRCRHETNYFCRQ